MSVRFCVLGSGSRGNAALVLTPRTRVLLDAGFTPAELASRMAAAGAGWDGLSAVLLTHLHDDHLRSSVLGQLARHGIRLVCHAGHLAGFAQTRHVHRLREQGLLRTFAEDEPVELGPDLRARPLLLPHDSTPTCGYYFEALDGQGRPRRLAYVADCGHWPAGLAQQLAAVDLLALEFNHDEGMERRSGRPPHLIARVLGPHGHLSNRQAAEALEEVLRAGTDGGPQTLVQLHLSRECNQPALAYSMAQAVIARLGARTKVFSSQQDRAGRVHVIG